MATGNTISDKINDIKNSKQLIITEMESKGMIFTKTVMLSDLHTEVKNNLVLNPNYYPIPSDNSVFTFTATGSTYEVAGTAQCPTKTIIPKTYNGKSVTKIKDSGFLNNTTTNLICIPNTVTSIGTSAFSGCTKLNDVRIPDSILNIGNEAFKNCAELETLTVLNKTVTIGYNALQNCSKFKLLIIPNKKCDEIKSMANYPWGLPNGIMIQGSDNKIEIGNILPGGYKRVEYISNQKIGSIKLPSDTKSIEMTFKHISSTRTGDDGGDWSFGQFPNYAFNISSSKAFSLWGPTSSSYRTLPSNEVTNMKYEISGNSRSLMCKPSTSTSWTNCGTDVYPTNKQYHFYKAGGGGWDLGSSYDFYPDSYFDINGSSHKSWHQGFEYEGYIQPDTRTHTEYNINMNIYQFVTKNSKGAVTMNLWPCHDESGAECFFDEISLKTIR